MTTDVTATPGAGRQRRPTASVADMLAQYGFLGATVVLFGVLAVSSDRFVSRANLLNVVDQQAATGIIACGATLAMIAGAMDISVAAIYSITGVVAAAVAADAGVLAGLVAAVLTGAACGLVNGLLITVGRIQSIIATLASGMAFRGFAMVVTGGLIINVTEPAFRVIGSDRLLSLRLPGWIFVAVIALTAFVLHRTTFGQHLYAVGGNLEAARLSGIRVALVRLSAMVLVGVACAIGGIIDVSRVSSAQAGTGIGLELTALAAVIIGGTSIHGGYGAIWRTVVGVFFLAMVGNGFNLLGIDPVYQQITLGALILAAIAVGTRSRHAQR